MRGLLSGTSPRRSARGLDLAEDGAGGYIEAETPGDSTKSGNTLKEARLQVPIVGLAFGLSFEPWAKAWLDLRKLVGLDASEDGCVMPEPLGDGTLGQRRIEAGQTTEWLKHILYKLGVQPAELGNIGSHSCNATLLALLAKIRATPDDRRMLGGHVQPGDKSMMEYSRDALAGPLDRMERALVLVREGVVDPDTTRSGRWTVRQDGASASSIVAASSSQTAQLEKEVKCSTFHAVISDGITIVETCECGASIHADPPFFGQCDNCAACRPKDKHSCIGGVGPDEDQSPDEHSARSSSTSDSEAIESVVAARPSANQVSDHTAKCTAEFPRCGAVMNKRWGAVHRKSVNEVRTACGLAAPEAAYILLEPCGLVGF